MRAAGHRANSLPQSLPAKVGVNSFAKVYFDSKATQDQLYAMLAPLVERFNARSLHYQFPTEEAPYAPKACLAIPKMRPQLLPKRAQAAT